MATIPTLDEVRADLVATLYCIAHTMDLQIRNGAGAAMLGLTPNTYLGEWPKLSDFDLSAVDIYDFDTVHRYAFYGELERSFVSDDYEEGNIGRLQTLLNITANYMFRRNVDDVREIYDAPESSGKLAEMVGLASARYCLDYDRHVSLSDIAILAKVNERTVRNALHAEGDSRLSAQRDENGGFSVEKLEALRWLRTRPNFRETVWIGSYWSTPVELAPHEIMPFLYKRLRQRFPGTAAMESLNGSRNDGLLYGNAASAVGVPEERIRALFEQSIDELSLDDCPIIAHLLYLDTAWLTSQVKRSSSNAGRMESQATAHPMAGLAVSPFNEVEGTLDIVLTDAGIRNGYFDIERRYADRFFPTDCFGSRGKADGSVGNILLHHDHKGSPYDTNLRVKSEALVSPRKRFSAYFTAHKAKAGDVIRIKRLGDRTYELTYLPKEGE